MRKITGWLCLVSFILGLAFAGYYAYVTLTPFFRGGELRYYGGGPDYDLNVQLADNGVSESDVAILRGYVTGRESVLTLRGWETVPQLVEAWNTGRIAEAPPSDILWIAVANKSGNVVASYPEKMAKFIGRVQQPTEEGWRGALGPDRHDSAIDVTEIRKHGKVLGSLAVAYSQMGWVAVVPLRAEVDARISPLTALWLSACSLVFCAILLPIWVAMDADWRGMRGGAWAVLVVVTGLIGFAAYLLARLAPPRQCPNCGDMVQSGYKRCPACGVALLAKCPKCGRKMRPGWQFCPRCTPEQPQHHHAEHLEAEHPEPVEGELVEAVEAEAEPTTVQIIPNLDDALPAASHSTLGATVVNAFTGAPVVGASLSIAGPSTMEGVTGQKGFFEARSLISGTYQVTATAQGYGTQETTVELAPDSSDSIRLVLTANAGVISGRVLDRSSLQPVPGARVFIDSARLERSANTDNDGVFVLGDILPGPYTVCAEAEGCARQTRLAEVVPGQHATVGFALEPAALDQEENTNAVQ